MKPFQTINSLPGVQYTSATSREVSESHLTVDSRHPATSLKPNKTNEKKFKQIASYHNIYDLSQNYKENVDYRNSRKTPRIKPYKPRLNTRGFKNDLTGKVFGRLTVIGFSHRDFRGTYFWKCKCSCGKETVIRAANLTGNHSRSCGCIGKEKFAEICKRTKHGYSKREHRGRVYTIWAGMIQRCSNPKSQNYIRYGGRGIKVCDEWNNPKTFIDWALSHGYRDDLTIDRIDNNGNYEPDNCQWATYSQQQLNKRKTKFSKGWFKSVDYRRNLGKFTPEQVLFIRKSNLTLPELASQFNCTPKHIQNIKNCKNYKQIKEAI